MTAKQIKFFGTKRQRAALKAKRKNKSKRKSSAHRKRSVPRAKANPAPRKKRRAAHRKASAPRRKKRVARKQNLGGIFALTANPAKGRKKMARTKRRKSSKAHRSAGTRRRKSNPARHHRHRSNPGGAFGSPKDWLSGGAGVLAGVVGTRSLPQLLLGASNTGAVGYLANAATTGILTFLSHMAFPRNKTLTGGVLAGGVASILSRVIGDYSLLGSYSSSAGLGDYLFNFNFATPQILGGDKRAIVGAGMPGPVSTPLSIGATYGANLY